MDVNTSNYTHNEEQRKNLQCDEISYDADLPQVDPSEPAEQQGAEQLLPSSGENQNIVPQSTGDTYINYDFHGSTIKNLCTGGEQRIFENSHRTSEDGGKYSF